MWCRVRCLFARKTQVGAKNALIIFLVKICCPIAQTKRKLNLNCNNWYLVLFFSKCTIAHCYLHCVTAKMAPIPIVAVAVIKIPLNHEALCGEKYASFLELLK